MTITAQFARQQADQCGQDADGAALANVRDRALRSQAAWLAMADRAEKTEESRRRREAAAAQAAADLAATLPS